MHVFKYNDEKDNVAGDFVDWLLDDPANNGYTCIAHNGGRFDNLFVLKYLLHNRGITPHITVANGGILAMRVDVGNGRAVDSRYPTVTVEGEQEEGNVEEREDITANMASTSTGRGRTRSSAHKHTVFFKDSFNFIPCALSTFPKTFGLTELKKGYFPYYMNTLSNYGKVFDKLPHVSHYGIAGWKKKARNTFLDWYRTNASKRFDFDQEIVDYCKSDVLLLTQGCLKFREEFLTSTQLDCFKVASTIPSACMRHFKNFLLRENTIAHIPELGYYARQRQSRIALLFLKWLQKETGMDIQAKLSSQGEKMIDISPGSTFYVDGFVDRNVEGKRPIIIEVDGCHGHGCLTCYPNQQERAVNGKTHNANRTATEIRKKKLQQAGYKVITYRTCEIEKWLRTNRSMRTFFKNERDRTVGPYLNYRLTNIQPVWKACSTLLHQSPPIWALSVLSMHVFTGTFTCLVSACTMGGKTVWTKKLIKNMDTLITPRIDKVWWCYGAYQQGLEELLKDSRVELVEGIPSIDTIKNTPGNKLLIFDDLMSELENTKLLNDCYTKLAHHNQLSIITLLQNLYACHRTVRVNSTAIVLLRNPTDALQRQTLARQLFPGNSGYLLEAYDDAVSRQFGYLLIDNHPQTDEDLRCLTNIFPDEHPIVAYTKKYNI
ncbi:hypothetical protein QR680_003807 [Steinernema hermaphroditum]|uniref:DNA-directed DNA polymerase n=1 Tax=Steinernema hermaphroditum TaxID=289476 RepID=A0AA39HLL6_9BILA|nr:hypothetical protein QR680_003807 [Steinernema hermaphroditum]